MPSFNTHAQSTAKEIDFHDNRIGSKDKFTLDRKLLTLANDLGATITIANADERPLIDRVIRSTPLDLTFKNGNGSQDITGTASEIKKHLMLLKQPVKTCLKNTESSKWYNRSAQQESREKVLSTLCFLTTASANLPSFEDLHEDDGDHSTIENAIAESNMWRDAPEINYLATDVKEPATIPNSFHDPSNGLTFLLHPNFKTQDKDANNATNALKTTLQKTLKSIKGEAAFEKALSSGRLSLTPEQMQTLCEKLQDQIQAPVFNALLEGTQHETRVSQAIQRVICDIKNPESELLKSYIKGAAQQDGTGEKAEKLKWAATTALTPLYQEKAFHSEIKHRNITSRKEAPLTSLQKDADVLHDVISHFQKDPNFSQMHIDAILSDPEFLEFTSFEKEMFGILSRGANKIKSLPKNQRAEAKQAYTKLANTLVQSSTSGATLHRNALSQSHEKVLDTLERTLGMGSDGISRVGKDFVLNTVEFTTDILKTPFKSWDSFSSFVGIGLLYHYLSQGGDTSAAEQTLPVETPAPAIDPSTQIAEEKLLDAMLAEAPEEVIAQLEKEYDALAGDLVLSDSTESAANALTSGQPASQCHIHNLGAMSYAHCINEGISGTSKTFANLEESLIRSFAEHNGIPTQETSAYFTALTSSIETSGKTIADLNVIQSTAGHYPLVTTVASNTLQHGPMNSAKQIFGSFNDFFDSSWTLITNKPLIPAALAAPIIFDDKVKELVTSYHMSDMSGQYPLLDVLTQSTVILAEAEKGFALPLVSAVAIGVIPTQKLLYNKRINAFHEALGANAKALTSHLSHEDTTPRYADDLDIIDASAHAAQTQDALLSQLPDNVREAYFPVNPASRVLGNAFDTALKAVGKTPNARAEFHVSAHNLKPTIEALQDFDNALNITTRFTGEESNLYKTIIHDKIKSFTDTLISFQNEEIDEKQLKRSIKQDLKSVIAAQTHLTGENSIYSTIYNAEPTKRVKRDLEHKGKIEKTRSNFQTEREGYAQQHKTSNEPHHLGLNERNPITDFQHQAYKLSEEEIHGMKNTRSALWGGLVEATQQTHRTVDYLFPNKKHAILGFMGIETALATSSVLGIGGEALSPTYAAASAAQGLAMNISMFALISAPDDIFVAHGMLGGTAIIGAAAGYYAYKGALKPSLEIAQAYEYDFALKGSQQEAGLAQKYAKLKSIIDKDFASRVNAVSDNIETLSTNDISTLNFSAEQINEISKTCEECGKCPLDEKQQIPISLLIYAQEPEKRPDECQLSEFVQA